MAAGEPGTESGRTNLASSRRAPSSGDFSMTISVRESGMPQTVSKNSPSTNVLPSTSRPSATKKAVTTSRSATVRPTWSKRRTCDIGPVLPSSYRPCIGHGRQYLVARPPRTLSAAESRVPRAAADECGRITAWPGPNGVGPTRTLPAACRIRSEAFVEQVRGGRRRPPVPEGNDMTASYTFDVFSSLDGYGSYGPAGDWGGYGGKQGPELLDHRRASFDHEQRMVFGATTFRQFVQMLADSTEESEVRDPWVTRMRSMPATVVSSTLEGLLDWPNATIVSGDA